MRRHWICFTLFCSSVLAQEPEFVMIPAGSFVFGCEREKGCVEVFAPQRVEFSRPFRMMKTEVTVGQFRAFVAATGYVTDAEKAGDEYHWKKPYFELGDRHPVVYMSGNDAEAFCAWLGARLPTEAEAEYANLAGSSHGNFWLDHTDGRHAWYRENSGGRPQPVATKLANAWGLHDMEGNAWEWTRGVPPQTQPYTFRGGGYATCPKPDPEATDHWRRIALMRLPTNDPARRRDDFGFRCVCEN